MQSETSAISSTLNDPLNNSLGSPPAAKKGSLWHVAALIMGIVFGPALLAWILTLIRFSQ